MARVARQESPSGIYHVIARGAGRRILFEDDEDRVFFLEKLSHYRGKHDASIFAWCLMENHVHILTKCELSSLSKLMSSLNTSFARYYNGRYGHVGPVFQDRFKSCPVDSDAYLMELIRYIHLNPQHAGISTYNAYPWSSYREYVGGMPGICAKDFVLSCFGGLQPFIGFHENAPDDEMLLDIDANDEDIKIKRAAMPDGEAVKLARRFFGDEFAGAIADMPRKERNAALQRLRACGLSVRQIERLTGVGRGVIQKL